MIGYVYCFGPQGKEVADWGKITGEDGKDYWFHKSFLDNCNIRSMEEGDAVDFEPEIDKQNRLRACHVRMKYQAKPKANIPDSGIHPNVNLSKFNSDEQKIIRFLGQKNKKLFYVSNGGNEFTLGESKYKYCLIKPTEYFFRTFSLTRELVVIFCDYVTFEPRSLDAAGKVYERIGSKLRLDKACYVFISHDDHIEEELAKVLKDGNLTQIVIPFSYRELMSKDADEGLVHDRFKKYLFEPDLFAVSSVITNESFFFGRRDYVHDIVAKCKNGTSSGVFGLRRSGKTSLLYTTRHLLEQQDYPVTYITCGDIASRDWRSALCFVMQKCFKTLRLDDQNVTDEYYSSKKTNEYFEYDMDACIKAIQVPLTIMFDEIEEITFGIPHGEGNEEKWIDGKNYNEFWRTIKNYILNHPQKISIVVAGTNPVINEKPFIEGLGETNPMHLFFSKSNQGAYLPAFTNEDTRNMVNTLGGYMAISFDDQTIGLMTSDCGGHPYLTRLLCSHINKYAKTENYKRPVRVTKALYEKARPDFEKSNEARYYFELILGILVSQYPSEYKTLKILALEGDRILSQVLDKNAIDHLKGYGLVDENNNNYAIKYDSITRYLKGEYAFERQGMNIDEQKAEILLRRDTAEIKLRSIVRINLKSFFGAKKAKECILDALGSLPEMSERKLKEAEDLDYSKLFDPSLVPMYISLLKTVILENYDIFRNAFEGESPETVKYNLEVINSARRCETHSYTEDSENWSWKDFEDFRKSMTWLEEILKDYE